MSAELQAQQWINHMRNDPEYYEKWMYTDNINAYNDIIEECRIKGLETIMKLAQTELAKIELEYDAFKKYKIRTSISE